MSWVHINCPISFVNYTVFLGETFRFRNLPVSVEAGAGSSETHPRERGQGPRVGGKAQNALTRNVPHFKCAPLTESNCN